MHDDGLDRLRDAMRLRRWLRALYLPRDRDFTEWIAKAVDTEGHDFVEALVRADCWVRAVKRDLRRVWRDCERLQESMPPYTRLYPEPAAMEQEARRRMRRCDEILRDLCAMQDLAVSLSPVLHAACQEFVKN